MTAGRLFHHLGICAVLLLGAGLARADNMPVVTIAVSRTPLSLPLFVAESRGYFAAENLNIRLDPVNGGYRALQVLLDGNADLATTSETRVMFNSFKRKDFVIISSIGSSIDDIKLVTRSGSNINSVAALAGKRIGVMKGTGSHYFLDTALILEGIDPGRVKIEDMHPEDMSKALQNGSVDAVAVWQPHPFALLAAMKDAVIIPVPHFYKLTFNLVARRNMTDDKHAATLVKLLHALDRAETFIASEPEQAQTIMQQVLSQQPDFIRWMWPRIDYRLSLQQSLLSSLESEARWARTQEYIKADGSPNYLDFIHTTSLRQVKPDAVNIPE